jgi:NAD(P)-dependent dehydrogenase (short-subunit alcohol dehydrogenase family)
VEEAHGGLDVLVNNAGVHRLGTAEATMHELWDAVMEVNLFGAFLGCKEAIPALRRRGGGAIVNPPRSPASAACPAKWPARRRRARSTP